MEDLFVELKYKATLIVGYLNRKEHGDEICNRNQSDNVAIFSTNPAFFLSSTPFRTFLLLMSVFPFLNNAEMHDKPVGPVGRGSDCDCVFLEVKPKEDDDGFDMWFKKVVGRIRLPDYYELCI